MSILVIDTETNGLFDFKQPADAPGQPRLAHLAMIHADLDGDVLWREDFYIRPDGWSMTAEASAINGLTDEFLIANGVPIGVALEGDVKTLVERRDGVIKAFAAFGVKPDQLFAALAIGGLDDITLETMPLLIGMHNALKSGEATVEEMFGAAATGTGDRKSLRGKLEDVASNGKKADAGKGKEKPVEEKKPEGGKPAEQKQDEAPGAEDKPADDDDGGFPGDTPAPSSDDIEAAKDRGGEAYHRGMSRRAMPQEYRSIPALSEAWLEAYDAAANDDGSMNGGDA